MSETVVREYPSSAIAVSSARRSRWRKLPLASSARPMSGASYRDTLLSLRWPVLEDFSDGGQAAIASHGGCVQRHIRGLRRTRYANDPQFSAAEPRNDVLEAVRRPGMRLAEILQTVIEAYENRS